MDSIGYTGVGFYWIYRSWTLYWIYRSWILLDLQELDYIRPTGVGLSIGSTGVGGIDSGIRYWVLSEVSLGTSSYRS